MHNSIYLDTKSIIKFKWLCIYGTHVGKCQELQYRWYSQSVKKRIKEIR